MGYRLEAGGWRSEASYLQPTAHSLNQGTEATVAR